MEIVEVPRPCNAAQDEALSAVCAGQLSDDVAFHAKKATLRRGATKRVRRTTSVVPATVHRFGFGRVRRTLWASGAG